MRGRPRKPTELKLLDGSFRADRDGAAASVVLAEGTPVKPGRLPKQVSAVWDEIVPEILKLGIARTVDATGLGKLCSALARSRTYERIVWRAHLDSAAHYRAAILLKMANKEYDTLAAHFGLTPATRARLRLEKPKATGVKRRDRTA